MKQKRIRWEFILLGLGVCCFILGGILGYRYYHIIRRGRMPHPRQTNVELIQGWMTIPYIARVYHVDENQLFLSLSIDQSQKTISVNTLAKQHNKNQDKFLQEVKLNVTTMMNIQNPPASKPGP